jgi:hypothetical protein
VRWQCYFWQQLADASIIMDSQQEATASLEQGLQLATEQGLMDQQVRGCSGRGPARPPGPA